MTQFVETPTDKFFSVYTPPVRLDTSHMPLLDADEVPKTILMQTLYRACSLRRENGTVTEGYFVAWLVNRLPVSLIDAAGNVHVDLRTLPSHRTMFTAHTDTAHYGGGTNDIRVDGHIWRANENSALGADDGAGVALLCHMIEHQIPGYYVFFRGEECGGVGSSWLAENMNWLFDEIDRAIAFDRAGYYDVITHQACGRCCSDAFALALATQLSTDTSWYQPCDTGVFTDTANFIDIIAECTNISVGYKNQHGDCEEQNVAFLQMLSEQVLKVVWDELPVVRNPKTKNIENSWHAESSKYSRSPPVIKDDLFDLDPTQLEAIGALNEALDSRDFNWLFDLIAETVCPTNKSSIRNQLREKRLTEEDLIEAIAEIEQGWATDTILEHLYEMCAVS